MSSNLEDRIRRPAGGLWPARPRAKNGPAGGALFLTSAQWRRLGARLCSTQDRRDAARMARTREVADAVLWVLHTGSPWSALAGAHPKPGVCRRQWKEWMLDGRWVDFWNAYVTQLPSPARVEWVRAFARAGAPAADGRAGLARHAWWLVCARLLLDGNPR